MDTVKDTRGICDGISLSNQDSGRPDRLFITSRPNDLPLIEQPLIITILTDTYVTQPPLVVPLTSIILLERCILAFD